MKITVDQIAQFQEDARVLHDHIDQQVKSMTTVDERSKLLVVVSAAHRTLNLSRQFGKAEINVKG